MQVTFDVITRQLSFDASGAEPWGGELGVCIKRHGQRRDIRGLSFGVTVTRDGAEKLSRTWPSAGVKFSRTDQDVLITERLEWNAEEFIDIAVWINIAGEEHTATWNLTAPRPPQPYASWTWDGTVWTPPAAYPDDGGEYFWDEGAQEWSA